MKTISGWAQDFYLQHESQFQNHYPGINLKIFKNHLKDIIENYPGISKDDLLLNIPSSDQKKLELDWLAGVPFAYITGFAYFYELKLKVHPSVLIPRFETEMILEMIPKDSSFILDLCAGPGTIGMGISAILKKPVKITLSDISMEAIHLAQLNVSNLRHHFHPQAEFSFNQSDCGANLKPSSFDLIVSNPPYIPESMKASVHSQVLNFEPALALYLKDQDYDAWFEKYLKQSFLLLMNDGTFIMEGHEDKINEVAQMALKIGFCDLTIINDYNQRPRFLKAKKGK